MHLLTSANNSPSPWPLQNTLSPGLFLSHVRKLDGGGILCPILQAGTTKFLSVKLQKIVSDRGSES